MQRKTEEELEESFAKALGQKLPIKKVSIFSQPKRDDQSFDNPKNVIREDRDTTLYV